MPIITPQIPETGKHYLNLPTKKESGIGIALAAACLFGALVGAHLLTPSMHSWINSHIVTPFSQMPAGSQILTTTVPIIGVGVFSLLVFSWKHRRPLHSTSPSPRTEYQNGKLGKVGDYSVNDKTSMNPKLKRALAGLAVMTILLVGTLIAAHTIYALNHAHLTLEQSALYASLPAGAATFMVSLVVARWNDKPQALKPAYQNVEVPFYYGI